MLVTVDDGDEKDVINFSDNLLVLLVTTTSDDKRLSSLTVVTLKW